MKKAVILFFAVSSLVLASCKKQLVSLDGPPVLTVLTPSGGELYAAGQLVTVRCGTRHVPAGSHVIARLINTAPGKPAVSVMLYPEHSVATSRGLATVNDGTERYRLPWQHGEDGEQLYANGITARTFTLQLSLGTIGTDGVWNAGTAPIEGVSKTAFTVKPSSLPDGCTTDQGYSETTGLPCFQ